MKKVTLAIMLLIGALSTKSVSAQSNWRTITVTNAVGFTGTGKSFNTTAGTLYYDVNKKYAVTNWTGMSFLSQGAPWVSSQTALVRKFGKLHLGGGIQYGGTQAEMLNNRNNTNSFYFIGTMSYTFKLK